ncbi:hypothetical protein PYCCODRAFT_1433400 [Trametes coccinea BRFM310]|uniref:Uncharacterized protein n=1 Tax=Trametes coccinea (strain BRFM310) TaxID=1353009 RepID=A0A1Y2ITT9_TRAC3|nr:hypothetical protein PYCCODRAFT_1433400 [Trametes coccinea BRFM310]
MPPRAQPVNFILLLKTHKLTVFLTFPNTSTVADVKREALDALTSSVLQNPEPNPEVMDDDSEEWAVPKVSSVADFELARAAKTQGRPTGRYEKLDVNAQLKSVVANWDPIFVQFMDEDGTLLPVKVSIPPISPEDYEDPSTQKGKRKADE